jgi:hypothetical protein
MVALLVSNDRSHAPSFCWRADRSHAPRGNAATDAPRQTRA